MGRTVLIVEDSLAMRRMIAFTLESHGYTVRQGCNGAEGLELLNQGPADLIIADVNMPVMDGITFVRQARTLPGASTIPILMLTTENLKSRVAEAREAGASGWLVKPFRPERLVEVIGRVLG
jgi:two-component system, chemotaxis family, chemotaxis protein CheY